MEDGKIVLPGQSIDSSRVSPQIRRRIDEWLVENNFNEYGDARDTIYMGGTPLFNESTGERIDRYQYILQNHPELGKL